MLVLAARSGTPEEFGRVAIAMAVYLVVVSAIKALVSEPLTIRHQMDVQQMRAKNAVTAGLLLSGSAAGVLVVVAAVLDDTQLADSPLLWLGICLPFLIWLDIQRYQWFAVGHPGRSAALDAAWVIGLVVAVGLQTDMDSFSVWRAWCLSGAAVGIFAMALGRGPGNLGAAVRWLRSHSDLGLRLFLETASTVLALNLAQVVFGVVADPSDVGAIRGAISLFGPLTIIFLGLYPVLIGRAQRSRHSMVYLTRYSTVIMTASALLVTVVLVFLPSSIGTQILGATWEPAHDIVWLIGLGVAAAGAAAGSILGLRALGAADASMQVRLVTALPAFVVPVAFGALWGAFGFAAGFSLVAAAATVLMRRAYVNALPTSEWAS